MSLYFQHNTTFIPRKVQEQTRKETERKQLAQHKLVRLAIAIFSLMIVMQMSVFAVFATKGEEITKLQAQQVKLNLENKELESKIYNLSSIENLQNFASDMKLEVSKKIVSIKVDSVNNVALGQ
ncbi:hypothetical protein IPJ91_01340 [bacterium]|nr:MAG: hypothetical protein IPJ91_01340 [bacterium]